VALGVALISASSMAAAESTGWYFGANLGEAQGDFDKAAYDNQVAAYFAFRGYPVISATSSLDDSDTSWSVFGGYSFSQHFSLEAGYVDLGTGKYRASGTVNPPGFTPSMPASFSGDSEVSGFTAAAVGTLPIGQIFEVHGRAGLLLADVDASEFASIGGSSRYSSESRDFFIGLGVGLHFGEQWSISLDWQQFKDVGDEDVVIETDIDRISLGVTYRL
jgi:OOP family OmpA-OmpF porin